MLDECPQCGQKLRSKWVRCPRCRLVLPVSAADTASASGHQPQPAIPRHWLLWGPAGCLAAGIIVIATSGETAAPVVTSTRSAATQVRSQSAPGEPGADGIRPEPAGVTVSFATVDAKRAAAAAYQQGDYATALAQLEAAVTASPIDAEARNNLAQLFVRQGRAADALPHFDEAVRLDGQRWAYRFNRARAYGLMDRWPEAIADYRVAATLFPEDHATLYNLGLALLHVRDYPAAAITLEQAVAAAPEQHEFLITLGTAYIGATQRDRARAILERFLELAPTDPEASRVKALLESLAASGE